MGVVMLMLEGQNRIKESIVDFFKQICLPLDCSNLTEVNTVLSIYWCLTIKGILSVLDIMAYQHYQTWHTQVFRGTKHNCNETYCSLEVDWEEESSAALDDNVSKAEGQGVVWVAVPPTEVNLLPKTCDSILKSFRNVADWAVTRVVMQNVPFATYEAVMEKATDDGDWQAVRVDYNEGVLIVHCPNLGHEILLELFDMMRLYGLELLVGGYELYNNALATPEAKPITSLTRHTASQQSSKNSTFLPIIIYMSWTKWLLTK
ncbi:hypothetical protein F4604DRAFT_1688382 [Suillus subluteus]|nr:hypothetical protein F4604DRAFT_1688382 [Suillus subluteus]